MTIQEMRDKLKALKKEMRELLGPKGKENVLTPEQETRLAAALEEAEALKGKIEMLERHEALENSIGESTGTVARARGSWGNAGHPPGGPAAEGAGGTQRIVVGDARERFNSLGEQMLAVMSFERRAEIDPRLRFEMPDGELRAATGLQSGVPSEGGFPIQTDFAAEVVRRVYETGVLVPLVRKVPISNPANMTVFNKMKDDDRTAGNRFGGIVAYWTNEAGQYAAGKLEWEQIRIYLEKLTGLMVATDEQLQDVSNLGAMTYELMTEEFGVMLDDAIYRGTGTGRPLGILNGKGLHTVPKVSGQEAGSVVLDNITAMWASCPARYRANAIWTINQELEQQLMKLHLKVGTAGVPLLMPPGGISGQQYSTIFGRPVLPIEVASAPGTVGDICLWDPRQYILVDKGSMEQATSIHVRFYYGEQAFRFTYRVNGQPMFDKVIKPMYGSASFRVSPYVALAARA